MFSLLGAHAEEVINLFALAIRSGLRSADLRHMVYAYPTSSSNVTYMVWLAWASGADEHLLERREPPCITAPICGSPA